MKRFAVVLIIAVLALGSVFAATNDVVVLETSVEKVIPCFEIYGDSTSHKGVQGITDDAAVAAATGDAVVTATIDESKDEVSLKVLVYEVGLKDSTRKDFIRYKDDSLTVTIKADSLKNKNYLNGTKTDMTETGAIKTVSTPTAFTAVKLETKEIHTVTAAAAADTVTLTAKYTGEKVSVGDTTTGLAVTDWTWTWDTSNLVAGETYRADITITYTVE